MAKTVVVVPVYGKFELALECLARVIKFSPSDLIIQVIDDGSPNGDQFEEMLRRAGFLEKIQFSRNQTNFGFVKTVNQAFRKTKPFNVLILNSDCFVSEGWLDPILETASSSDLVSTVTAMTNNGSIASVALDNERISEMGLDKFDELNYKLIKSKADYVVQLPTGVGHCMWISRVSLEVVGYFDEAFSPGYGEEVDFCIRATRSGFIHLMCPKVLVYHIGGSSFGTSRQDIQNSHEDILRSRYPAFHEVAAGLTDRSSELQATFMNVLTLVRPIRILLDCRLASPPLTGTSRFSIEVATALSELDGIQVTLLIESTLRTEFELYFDADRLILSSNCLSYIAEKGKFDIVYRIGQVGSLNVLEGLWTLARRVAVIQLDFIAADNFHYFTDAGAYLRFVDVTKHALVLADSVLYLSKYVELEATRFKRVPDSEEYLDCGADHVSVEEIARAPERSVLVLGAAFAHKNRRWVLKMAAKLIACGMSDLKIIMVGPTPAGDASSFDEVHLVRELGIAQNVTFIDWVAEEHLESLIGNVGVSVSASVSEGFGMVPLEMARRGVVPLAYSGTSFSEHAGSLPYSLTLSDLDHDCESLQRLLTDPYARESQLASARHLASRYRWLDVAEKIAKNSRATVCSPSKVPIETRREFFRKNKVEKRIQLPVLVGLWNSTARRRLLPDGHRRTAIFVRAVSKFFRLWS